MPSYAMRPTPVFDRVAGPASIALGGGGILYSLFFMLNLDEPTTALTQITNLTLMLGGLVGVVVFVALYRLLRTVDPAIAMLGLILGVASALGTAIHGGYDLGVVESLPSGLREFSEGFKGLATSPNPVDPRGLLTFAVAGLALATFSYLMVGSNRIDRRLGMLGSASAVLLEVIYVARLTIVDPKSPLLLVSTILEGFIVNPAFYIWLGLELIRRPVSAVDTPQPARTEQTKEL